MTSFSKRFRSEGLGAIGDYRVIVRQALRLGDESIVQIMDDSDGVGMGFSIREAEFVIEQLQLGVAMLKKEREAVLNRFRDQPPSGPLTTTKE